MGALNFSAGRRTVQTVNKFNNNNRKGGSMPVKIRRIWKGVPGYDSVPGIIVDNNQVAEILMERGLSQAKKKKLSGKALDEHLTSYLTDDEWITTRTGISLRSYADPSLKLTDMAATVFSAMCKETGLSINDFDSVGFSTVTNEYLQAPPTSTNFLEKVGYKPRRRMFPADVSLACSSFPAALVREWALIESGVSKRSAVIGGDFMSRVANVDDRTTYPLFGDAVAIMVLEWSDEESSFVSGPNAFHSEVVPQKLRRIITPSGGSVKELTEELLLLNEHKLAMEGKYVFMDIMKFLFPSDDFSHESPLAIACAAAGIQDINEIDYIIPHQANLRISDGIVERLEKATGFKCEKILHNIEKYGNTTSATIPLLMSETIDAGLLTPGKKFMLLSMGAGYTVHTVIGTM